MSRSSRPSRWVWIAVAAVVLAVAGVIVVRRRAPAARAEVPLSPPSPRAAEVPLRSARGVVLALSVALLCLATVVAAFVYSPRRGPLAFVRPPTPVWSWPPNRPPLDYGRPTAPPQPDLRSTPEPVTLSGIAGETATVVLRRDNGEPVQVRLQPGGELLNDHPELHAQPGAHLIAVTVWVKNAGRTPFPADVGDSLAWVLDFEGYAYARDAALTERLAAGQPRIRLLQPGARISRTMVFQVALSPIHFRFGPWPGVENEVAEWQLAV